jgi:hypothetical protein
MLIAGGIVVSKLHVHLDRAYLDTSLSLWS